MCLRKDDMIYYGLEDGTFMGAYYSARAATFREPGESGYQLITDDNGELTPLQQDMQKYFTGCINESGEQVSCIIPVGASYIQCVDDCELQVCQENESHGDDNTTKWCKKYTIQEVNETQNLGYVPRSYYCLSKDGVPTQEINMVVNNRENEYGSCYFQDGETLVNRNKTGEYTYCQQNGISTNITASCNIFEGAYRSIQYDPRYRTWYVDTRSLQIPNWSSPYIFFTNRQMGITYNVPIYTEEEERSVFYGVTAVDMKLQDLADYLAYNYGESETVVAIVEDAEPNYVIALSSGTAGAKKVISDDPTLPCTNEEEQDCIAVRITIDELEDSANILDVAASKAFTSQSENEFPSGELVAFQVDEMAYASETVEYTTDGLKWRIVILQPLEIDSEDTILPGSSNMAIIIVPSMLGATICAILLALFWDNRKKRDVVFSDFRFTSIFMVGCIFLNLSCLTFIGENTDEMCMLRMWMLHFFFVFTIAPLFAKIFRMYLLVGQTSTTRRKISHVKTAMMQLPFLLTQIIILLIFTFVDPSKQEVMFDQGNDVTYRVVCAHNTSAFFWVQLAYEGGLVLLGCVLAYKTRNMNDDFGEAKQLILAMYNIALIGTIILVVANVIETSSGTLRMFITIGVCWCTCFSSSVFVLPRLLRVRAAARPGATRTRTHVSGVQRYNSMGSAGSIANDMNQSGLNTATQGNTESTPKVTFQPNKLRMSDHDAAKVEAGKSDVNSSMIKIEESKSSNNEAVKEDNDSSSLRNESSTDKASRGDHGSPTDNEVPVWVTEANESDQWEDIIVPPVEESAKEEAGKCDNESPIWVNDANDSDSDEIIPFTGPY